MPLNPLLRDAMGLVYAFLGISSYFLLELVRLNASFVIGLVCVEEQVPLGEDPKL